MSGSHDMYDKLSDPAAGFPTAGRIIKLPAGYMFGWGLVADNPGGGIEGWAPGALFIQTDGSADDQVFFNEGTVTSATFTLVSGMG